MAVAMRTGILVPLCALAASCGPNPSDPGPGGVSVSEAKALDEAAEMLEQRRTPDGGEPKGDDTDARATGEEDTP